MAGPTVYSANNGASFSMSGWPDLREVLLLNPLESPTQRLVHSAVTRKLLPAKI